MLKKQLITGIKKILRLLRPSKLIGFFERLSDTLFMVPVIIKCVSWDYSSLLRIMDAWLSRMQISHEKDTWHTDADVSVQQIKEVRFLIKRILENDYSHVKAHYEKWGAPNLITSPSELFKDCTTIKFEYSKDADLQKLSEQEFTEAYKKDTYSEEQDWDFLFKYLRKNLRAWWT